MRRRRKGRRRGYSERRRNDNPKDAIVTASQTSEPAESLFGLAECLFSVVDGILGVLARRVDCLQ